LDTAEEAVTESLSDQNIRGRVIRKKRSIGLIPASEQAIIPREALDETVLRCHMKVSCMNNGAGPNLPFCAFNGGKDAWVDAGNKRVAVQILGSYLGIDARDTLHIGDQFLNTGNDYAARAVCPCIWITAPDETTYILKTVCRLAGVPYQLENEKEAKAILSGQSLSTVDFTEMERRTQAVDMDVYTGEIKK
jgi:IMP and pyridine-specific 5'-nucleotidase